MVVRPLTATQMGMLGFAPVLMVAVSLFERRWGPRVAGIIAAAPVTGFIGLLLVYSTLGADASVVMAERMSGYLPAQVAVALTVALLVGRARFPTALGAGVVAYAAVATASLQLPAPVAIGASVVVIVAAQRFARAPDGPAVDSAQTSRSGAAMIVLRAGVSLATALALLLAAQSFGPGVGGAVAAFPMFSVTLCVFVHHAHGPSGVRRVMSGVVRGLVPYLACVLVYGLTLRVTGVVPASLAAIAACAASYVLSRTTRSPGPAGRPTPRRAPSAPARR